MSTISSTRLSLIAAILTVLCVLAALPTRAAAQNVASITGVVSDPTGAMIPGVQVSLENPETGVTYKTTTNDSGSYTVNEVKPGPGYKIQFAREGFKAVIVSGIYMNVDNTRVQNAQLSLGGTVETVEVSAANQNVTLDTTDATVGNNFQVQVLNDMPVQDRSNPSALFVQQPGVTLDGAVTGARTDQNRVTLDGLDVNDLATGQFGYIVGRAPVDSVQEFRGVSAGFLSDAAGGGGGQYELVTKSGTNSFHGSLVEYHRDTTLEANDWFNNNSGVPRPPLIRNQFGGSVGGPILKNKLFFFFTYNGRRDTLSALEERTVPMDSFRSGTLTYINDSNNLETLSAAQVAGFDPQHVGFNSALLSLFDSRYPHANDLSGGAGDLINTAGYRFNAPFPYKEDDYVQRVDYNLNDKMKLWGKGNFVRTNGTQSAVQFPGDPVTSPFIDRSYAWVVGHVWTINTRMVNNAAYGETYENFNFPNTYNPTGATQYTAVGGNGSGGTILTGPYASAINAQGRTYPIPVIRDDFSWDKGNHAFRFGGTFKYITPRDYTILNYNVPTIGLGGPMPALDDSFRPSDICPASAPPQQCDASATGLYDPAFALALAPYTQVSSTFNYDAQGNVLQQGSGQQHTYRYYETELYFGDTWKIRPRLTVSYGLRWINYSVPYDTHGIESIQNYDFDTYFNARLAQSAASQSGNSAVPLIAYSLGGKANHAPGYFKPQYTNFAPRLAVAYQFNPKTVFNAGAGIIYDQTVVNAVQYQQSQFSYLFQAGANQPYGDPNSITNTLLQDSRFIGLNSPPPAPTAPTITKPFYPYVDSTGTPYGLANLGAFNEIIDPKLKTPYSIQMNFGFEHELPAGLILRASYVGRLGRRLLAQADANQLIEFKDTVSGQLMSDAFANITQELRTNQPVTSQPWFENVLPTLASPGQNTAILADSFLSTYIARGDFADFTAFLAYFGLLPPNVGMGAQFSENTYYTNKGSSNYHGLLTTLHKNVSHGLQFDLNYTWSHSIDNVSLIANAAAFGGYGFICDVLRPRECRSNSDFDVTHYFNGNFVYELPLGRGKALASGAPRWLDEIIGGWSISGLPNWHSGNVMFASSNAFVAGYSNDAPAILTGPTSDLHIHINGGHGQALNGFADTAKANADFVGPIGFNIGSRNNLRAPSYFDMDMGLGKAFPLSSERFAVKFRADAFNVFNHPNFEAPCMDITNVSCNFGVISSTVGTSIRNAGPAARVLQLALRLEF
ncbi:MAG TPA: carboxypeptidase-like regulatory domain-containing protein [Candidatus Sulfotelmatobacter sp.]|nr:carboxypeptidase-like regulatory domain-containing protein [Candidatus Sulfotelmatobacter sp.]